MYSLTGSVICIFWRTLFFVYFYVLRVYFNMPARTFQVRYYMTVIIKGYQKYDNSKLKVQFLCSKFRRFNFELSYFWYPLNVRVSHWKGLTRGKYEPRGLCRSSWKVPIYYMNGVLVCFQWPALHCTLSLCLGKPQWHRDCHEPQSNYDFFGVN